MMMRRRLLIVLLMVFTACNDPGSSVTPGSPEQGWREETLDVEPARYFAVEPLGDGRLLLLNAASEDPSDTVASVFSPDEGTQQDLALPEDKRCLRTRFLHPEPTGARSVDFVKACSGQDGRFRYSLVRYDLASEKTRTIIGETDFFEVANSGVVGPITRGPAASDMLTGIGDAMCSSFAFLDAAGVRFPTLEVDVGGATWSPADLSTEVGRSCERGSGGSPAWAPDGHAVAFAASTDIARFEGFARLDASWDVFTAPPDLSTASAVLQGVVAPGLLTWSPDSSGIAFRGRVGGQDGTWILDPSTGDVELVAAEQAEALAWASNDRLLAAFPPPSLVEGPSRVVMLTR